MLTIDSSIATSSQPQTFTVRDTVKGIIQRIVESSKVTLSHGPFSYRAHSDDFGISLRKLLFIKPNSSTEEIIAYHNTGIRTNLFVENLLCIAFKEGFCLELTDYQFCPRDNIIALPNGTFVLTKESPHTPKAIERANSLGLVTKSKAFCMTDNLFFQGSMGTSQEHFGKSFHEYTKRFGTPPCMHFFFEGGNCYRSSNASGRSKLLLGSDLFPIILNQLRAEKFFDQPDIFLEKAAKTIQSTLTTEKIHLTISEMYAQGLLASNKGCEKGLITKEELSNIFSERVKLFKRTTDSFLSATSSSSSSSSSTDQSGDHHLLDLGIALGYYKPLAITQTQIDKCASIAAKYLAQKEIVTELLARTFSIEKRDVIAIPQADYHLDIFMRPGPKGSYFVQDYQTCIALLQDIQTHQEALGLSLRDREMLERYIKTATKLHSEIGPMLYSVQEILKKSGFYVIPTPALFYDTSPEEGMDGTTYTVNFMNSLTGWSEKNQHYFYIATGAEVGDQLGSLLMDSFAQFLNSYQERIVVHFVGHDSAQPPHFTEGMRWNNRYGSQAGPHCFGLNLETATHRD